MNADTTALQVGQAAVTESSGLYGSRAVALNRRRPPLRLQSVQ